MSNYKVELVWHVIVHNADNEDEARRTATESLVEQISTNTDDLEWKVIKQP